MSRDWCGRSVLYSARNASTAACAVFRSGQTPTWSSSSRCGVWPNRSAFPVVVGVWLGVAGNDAVLPADPLEHHLSRAGPGEPVDELLAIVGEHLVGMPKRCNASANAAHTARPVARWPDN